MRYAVAGVVFAVYLITLCPTIYVGDSGELVTAAAELGVAHPPGYPLYMLLGRLFSLLPVGEVALRLNLLSAVCGGAAAYMLALLLGGIPARVRRQNDGAAIAASATVILLFAFSRTTWSEMVKAEVYGLNVLLIAAVLWSTFRGRRPVLTFFLLGLGAANHQTILLLVPGILYYYWSRGSLDARLLGRGAVAFFVAASLYLVLLVRPGSPELFAWRKPETISGLLAHITREQYGALSVQARSVSLLGSQLVWLLVFILREMTVVALLVPFAIAAAWRSSGSPMQRSLTIHFALFSVGLLLLLNHGVGPRDGAVAQVYYIPAILLGFLLAAPLLKDLVARMAQRSPVPPFAVIVLSIVPLMWNWSVSSARDFRLGDETGTAVLEAVAQDGHLLTTGDNNTFLLYYLQRVEGLRPDVRILDRDLNFYPERLGIDPRRPGRKAALNAAVLKLVSSGEPVYSVTDFAKETVAGKQLRSAGPVYQFVSSQGEIAPTRLEFFHRDGFPPGALTGDYLARRYVVSYLSRWIDHYKQIDDSVGLTEVNELLLASVPELREAQFVRGVGEAAAGDTAGAVAALEKTLAIDPDFAQARRNLANIYVGMENYVSAATEYRLAAETSGSAGDWLNLGNCLLNSADSSGAAQAYYSALKGEGVDPLITLGLAKGFGRLGIDRMGVDLLGQLEAADSETFSEYEALADGYDRMGNVAQALTYYEIAKERHPLSPSIAYKLGVAFIRIGKNPEAEDELERAIALDSSLAGAYNALAYLFVESGRNLERAAELVERGIRFATLNELGYFYDTKGVVLARLDKPEQALDAFRVALEQTPVSDLAARAETYVHVADLNAVMGNQVEEAYARQKADSLSRLLK